VYAWWAWRFGGCALYTMVSVRRYCTEIPILFDVKGTFWCFGYQKYDSKGIRSRGIGNIDLVSLAALGNSVNVSVFRYDFKNYP
jgi:hypothetical protein